MSLIEICWDEQKDGTINNARSVFDGGIKKLQFAYFNDVV
jgi:hypothetical protein